MSYIYAPLSRGSATSTAIVSLTNGNANGLNGAQTVSASVAAQGVGPVYQSTVASTINTPTPVPGGATAATGPTIQFGTLATHTYNTVYLDLANITTDPNGGNANLTDLTLESFKVGGPDASDFSATLANNTVISKGGSVVVPLKVYGGSLGSLTGLLTFYTDESAGYGGTGDTFTYQLAAQVGVAEPASLVALATGLAGLASVRRKRFRERV